MLLDDADAARRRYKKDLDFIKPDLAAYNRQKEIALGLAPGTLEKAGSSSSTAANALTTFDPSSSSVRRDLGGYHWILQTLQSTPTRQLS